MAQEIKCCNCKTNFWMNDTDYASFKRGAENQPFYCPYGHRQWFVRGETEEQKLRRERDRLKQQLAYKDDCIRHAERSANAYKGEVTRLKNRSAAGVCPCCNRTFKHLAAHMKTKHPEFNKDDAA